MKIIALKSCAMVGFILCLFWGGEVSSALAASLEGTYSHVRDSDGTTPKAKASVTLTFKGGASGSVTLLATQPGETVKDSGKYFTKGTLITMQFKEMEWEAKKQPFQFDGCILTLPFKALSSKPGPGTSTWVKNDAGCSEKSTQSLPQNNKDNTSAMSDDPNKSTKETCEQCKYINCIKSFIKLREAYIREFQNAAKQKNWGSLEKEGDDFFDLSTLVTPEARKAATDEFNQQRADFWNEFKTKIDKKLVDDVKKHCNIQVSGSLTAKTDPLFCEIDENSMKEVENALPCKELAQSSRIHESYHKTRCMERAEKLKQNKGPFIPTARGEVKEDMEAYKQQVSILKGLLERITKTKNGCWRCGKTQEIYPDKKECNVNCPNVKLGGNLVFKCFKINTPDGEHVMKLGDQF